MGTRTGLAAVALAALATSGTVRAAEVTRVLTSRGLKDFDFHFSLAWQHDQSTASVRREYVQTTGPVVVNDVIYRQSRDALRVQADAAVVRDVSLFLAGSLVIADDRRLDFDRRGECAATPCLETLLADHFLPGDRNASWGIDAKHEGGFQAPSNHVFRGPKRSGFEYLGLGLRWAAMNQARDPTKPTWLLGLESRFSVAGNQRFNPAKPGANQAVGLGYHQLILSSTFSRRFGAFEPYMGAWFMQPIMTSSSVYKNVGSGAPQRRTGGSLGIEGTVWEHPGHDARIALEAAGRIEYRLAGLAQSELWEVLSGDPDCVSKGSCRDGIDVNGSVPTPNPGVVRSPAYGLFGGDAGFSAHLGRYARVRSLFGMRFTEDHALTDGGSGNAVYDVPGRRFRIEGAYSWHILLDATATF
jgi:hypothetical protein